jgi:hypothetical protein
VKPVRVNRADKNNRKGLELTSIAPSISVILAIRDSPYYVFVALCIVVIVVSLIKKAASNENIECFREYFAVGYRAPDPSFFKSSCTGQDKR